MTSPLELYVNSTILAEDIEPFKAPSAPELTTSLGTTFGLVQTVFRVIAIVILVIVVWRVAKSFAAGKNTDVVRTAALGVVGAILCWNLALPIGLINALGQAASNAFSDVGTVVEENAPAN